MIHILLFNVTYICLFVGQGCCLAYQSDFVKHSEDTYLCLTACAYVLGIF